MNNLLTLSLILAATSFSTLSFAKAESSNSSIGGKLGSVKVDGDSGVKIGGE